MGDTGRQFRLVSSSEKRDRVCNEKLAYALKIFLIRCAIAACAAYSHAFADRSEIIGSCNPLVEEAILFVACKTLATVGEALKTKEEN